MKNRCYGIILVIGIILAMLALAGCNGQAKINENKVIVCTVFPQYDWVRNIIGDIEGYEVKLLIKDGTDIHSYQPTIADVAMITNSDMLIYVGGESDAWIDEIVEPETKDIVKVSLLGCIGDSAREEELVEGMQLPKEEGDEEEPEYDEHVWLSLKNASLLCECVAEEIAALDESNRETIIKNTHEYVAELKTLDDMYAQGLAGARLNTLIFTDRFPFRYLMDDYGLDYYAAFLGCSAETEASFETIRFLADKLTELKLPAVVILDGADDAMAKTVVATSDNKDAVILRLDSMQSVTAGNIEAGTTYIGIVNSNYEVLKTALDF